MDLDLSKNMFRYFAVKFTQNKMTDKDPRKRCKNYIKTSYNDCDEEFIKTELEMNYPPGFLPIWATANLSLVTTAISTNIDSFASTCADIVSGTMESNCSPPCTSTEIASVFLDEKYVSDFSRVDITISEQISITVTDFPKFNLAVFLSAFGGSMGMWLGLGVVQTIEMLINTLWRIKLNN